MCQAWARAFLDVLDAVPEASLGEHLASTRTATVDGARCLLYRPGQFTRLPHRYYNFRWAGVDVFALDSNTFNQPLPAGDDDDGELRERRRRLDTERASMLLSLGPLSGDEDACDDRAAKAEQLDEQIRDIDKQLTSGPRAVDEAQLDWFANALIASWRNPAVRGRLLVLHHPPYFTETSMWDQGQTLAVRAQQHQALGLQESQPIPQQVAARPPSC